MEQIYTDAVISVAAKFRRPLSPRSFAGYRQPPVQVVSRRTARFEVLARGDGDWLLHLDAFGLAGVAHRAGVYIVIAFVVGIPGDGDFAIRTGGDGWIPIARGRERNTLFTREAIAAALNC